MIDRTDPYFILRHWNGDVRQFEDKPTAVYVQIRELLAERDRLAVNHEALIRRQVAIQQQLADVQDERNKLQAFKDWVHGYLDSKGVPHHPPGMHGAAGCRIGDRMDWVWEKIENTKSDDLWRDIADRRLIERDRLAELPNWIIRKLKTLGEYYEPPTDGRDMKSEIQGWMHVLCFHYEQNRREVKEYDAARREADRLAAELAELQAACEPIRAVQEARERVWKKTGIDLPAEKVIDRWDDGTVDRVVTVGDLRRIAALLARAPTDAHAAGLLRDTGNQVKEDRP